MAGVSGNDTERVLGYQFGGIVRTTLEPSEVDTTDGTVIYTRWSNRTVPEYIMRVHKSGNAWITSQIKGLWANRAILNYTIIEMGGA